MATILRFYGESKNGYIEPIAGQRVEEILNEVKIPLPKDATSNYFEVQISLEDNSNTKVKALDTDYIRPAALEAARDYNEQVIIEMSETHKETNYFADKMLLQEVVDRTLAYKEDFLNDLQVLFRKYDLDVVIEKTGLGSTRIVKKKK